MLAQSKHKKKYSENMRREKESREKTSKFECLTYEFVGKYIFTHCIYIGTSAHAGPVRCVTNFTRYIFSVPPPFSI